jgi:hypothetical protein
MSKLLGTTLVFLLTSTLVFAAPPQGRHGGHDRGLHKGWEKHHDQDRNEHRNWDFERERWVAGRPFPHGRFRGVGGTFVFRTVDFPARRVILADRSAWIVAPYDIDRCRDWRWDRDRVVVYDDDVHPGWYVLFNTRLGSHVHVEYFGVG